MAVLKNVRAYIAGRGPSAARISSYGRAGSRRSRRRAPPRAKRYTKYRRARSFLRDSSTSTYTARAGRTRWDATQEALSAIANTLAKEGTTSFLATTMTQTEGKYLARRCAPPTNTYGRNIRTAPPIVGIHLEGPFISAQFRGAQKEDCILPPSVETFRRFNAAAGGHIRLVTVAPEEEGAAQLIEYLKKGGHRRLDRTQRGDLCAGTGSRSARARET